MRPDARWSMWRRRQRRAILGQAFQVLASAGLLAFMIWSGIKVWLMLAEHSPGATIAAPTAWPMALILPLFLLWWLVVSIRGTRRALRVFRRVPARDGAVCWNCLDDLEPGVSESRRLRCQRCELNTGREQARTYWEQTHIAPLWAMHWRARHGGRRRRRWRTLLVAFAHRTRDRPRLRQVVIFLLGLVPTLVITFIMGLFIGRTLAIAIFGIILLSGIVGLAVNPTARSKRGAPMSAAGGVERRCAGCGYDIALLSDLPERCPECGASFELVGAVRMVARQERVFSKKRMVLSFTAFGLFCLAPTFLLLTGSAWIMRPLPTGVLTSFLGETLLGDAAVKELQRRSLTVDQQRTLIERALELRGRDDMSAYEARKALDPFVLAGTMPGDLLSRYLVDGATFTVAGPDAWDGQRPLRLLLEVDDRSGSGVAPGIGVLFGGWTIDGATAPGPAGVPGSVIHPLLLVDRSRRMAASYELAPPLELGRAPELASRRGTERIVAQAKVWLILTPGTLGGTIVQWNPDGTPILPPGVILARDVSVEHEVRLIAAPASPTR